MKSALEKFEVGFEDTPSERIVERITTEVTKSHVKIKKVRDGWIAQVRYYDEGAAERTEICEIGMSPRDALMRLDKTVDNKGLYKAKRS